MLQRDPGRRLGFKKDAEEVKGHQFFKGVDWTLVQNKGLVPPKIMPTEVPDHGVPVEDIYGSCVDETHKKINGWSFVSE